MPRTSRKQKRSVGRPRRHVEPDQINNLRGQGLSFREIAQQTGLGYGTVRRVLLRSGSSSPETGPSGNAES